jgi:hypothetical protein
MITVWCTYSYGTNESECLRAIPLSTAFPLSSEEVSTIRSMFSASIRVCAFF